MTVLQICGRCGATAERNYYGEMPKGWTEISFRRTYNHADESFVLCEVCKTRIREEIVAR